MSERDLKKEVLEHAFELFADRIKAEMVRSWFGEEYGDFTIKQTEDRTIMDTWYAEKKKLLWDALTELEGEFARIPKTEEIVSKENVCVSVVQVEDKNNVSVELFEVHFKGMEEFSKVFASYLQSGWSMPGAAQGVVDWLIDKDNPYPRLLNNNPVTSKVQLIVINDRRCES